MIISRTSGANRLWKHQTLHLVQNLDSHNVQRLMQCSVNAEKECRRADQPGQPADRTAALKAQVRCAGVIQACIGQLPPTAVRAARREAGSVDAFAQALQKRLSGEQARAASRAYQADPLVRLLELE